MIKGLRDLSQVEQGQVHPETVDLDDIIKEVIDSLELVIADTKAQVGAGPLPKVNADRFQMLQLFTNLVHNAIKFRKPDEVPQVWISGRQTEGDWVEIQVEDKGIGFDLKYAEKIFEPFQRLHGEKAYSGSGLGLAIAEKIVLRHGGKITVKSDPGAGAVFTVRLPGLFNDN